MKKLFFLLCAIFAFAHLSAQTTEHLSFRDIPIDGPINNFVTKLEAKGYIKVEEFRNGVKMSGPFVNKECELYIFCTPKTRIATMVTVYLPKDESWSSLKSDYFSFKDQYSTKYGKPSNNFELFSKPYYEGDGYELQALRNNKCSFMSFWNLGSGTIAVGISEFYQISFTYEDAINIAISKREKNAAIQDEI